MCVVCPTGCRLRTREAEDGAEVVGAACERGMEYAENELVNPMRTFTGTVRVRGGTLPVVPVRAPGLVPREVLREIAREAGRIVVDAPVRAGDTLAEGLSEGTTLIATADAPDAELRS